MTIIGDDALRNEARQYKSELLNQLFPSDGAVLAAATDEGPGSAIAALPAEGNIRGVGYGAKVTSGAGVDEVAVRVYVRAKQPKHRLTASELVPSEINGRPTDVIAVGDIHAAAVPCGVSAAHINVTAGTIGCLVTIAEAPGRLFLLSNNHILANANAILGGGSDRILQPGALDGGRPPHIAVLADFEPLRFGNVANFIDAAVAELVDPDLVTRDIRIIGNIAQPPLAPAVYQSVRKHGRTTLHTLGVIMDVAADIRVGYGNRTAAFEDQIAVTGVNGWFADRGDSGSLVVDAVTRRAVGLLFAVAQGITFCNPIGLVLQRFGAQIV